MAKLIFDLHSRIEYAVKQGLTGFISPDRSDQEAFAEINNIWLANISNYAQTQEIALFFKPFERIEAVTVAGGSSSEGNQTVTNCHKYPISAKTTAGGKRVSVVTIAEYDDLFNHPNKPPTVDYPIAKFIGSTIYVAPKMDVTVTYIGTPITPKYATTLVGDEYVYDDSGSVDIEFDKVWNDRIVNRVLANLGIAQREIDLIQYSNAERAAEGK